MPIRTPNEIQPGNTETSVRVWDLPTRIFHWILVVLVVISIYTGNVGGVGEMDLHMLSGYGILVLVLFRVAWGLIGSRHSRFTDFVRGPAVVIAYARDLISGLHKAVLGHNPLGGWSVLAMLTSLLLQAITGLFANDDILTEGPLAGTVSKALSNTLTEVHEINASVLYILIAIHLAAVFYYLIGHRENLIRPMLTGRKNVNGIDRGAGSPVVSPVLAALLLIAAGLAVWALVSVG